MKEGMDHFMEFVREVLESKGSEKSKGNFHANFNDTKKSGGDSFERNGNK